LLAGSHKDRRVIIVTVPRTEALPIAIDVCFSGAQLSDAGIVKAIADLNSAWIGQSAEIIAVAFTGSEAINVLITLIYRDLTRTGVVDAITQLGGPRVSGGSLVITVVASTNSIAILIDDIRIIGLGEAIAVTVDAITDLSKARTHQRSTIITVPSA